VWCFLFLFGCHLELILFPFSLTPAQQLVIDLSITARAANMAPPYNAPLVLVLLTNPANALVLLTQRKSGKCDSWCCLLRISMTNGGTGTVPPLLTVGTVPVPQGLQ
jgi:hypothetical protein